VWRLRLGPDVTSALAGHPAVDVATAAAAVVLQDREIVGLDPWLLDAAVVCGRESVPLQLVTTAQTRLTTPLASFVVDNSVRWVVRCGEGRWYDGMSGRLLAWDGSAFVPIGDEIAAEFVERFESTESSVVLDATVSHAASTSLRLGEIAEVCCYELGGAPPAGWGVAEPVTQRWDRMALTALCRQRAPRPTALVIVGGTHERLALGTLTISRTSSGVVERLRLTVGAPMNEAGCDLLVERIAYLPTPPRTMLIGWQPGRSDGTVEPRLTAAMVPYGFFVGPDAVAQIGRHRVITTPAARMIGPLNAESCWIPARADSADDDPASRLADMLNSLRT
jgi:hypothetical protein